MIPFSNVPTLAFNFTSIFCFYLFTKLNNFRSFFKPGQITDNQLCHDQLLISNINVMHVNMWVIQRRSINSMAKKKKAEILRFHSVITIYVLPKRGMGGVGIECVCLPEKNKGYSFL